MKRKLQKFYVRWVEKREHETEVVAENEEAAIQIALKENGERQEDLPEEPIAFAA